MYYHFLALVTACLWGCTFVASKVLLNAGLTPAEIMCLRFLIAWLLMLPWAHRQLRTSWHDELLFVVLGLMGGSLYFLAENTAVKLTTSTSTVALIICTTPIVTALMNRLVHRDEHLSNRFLFGTLVALVGVTLVIFNGVFVLDLAPLVILLSFLASVTWGVYSLVIRKLEKRYSSKVITRKIFFWGVVTMLPVCLLELDNPAEKLAILGETQVWITLVFLSLIASLGCYLAWNIVIRRIGIITAGNYLYFNPVTSLLAAWWILDERITWLAVIGCALTIAGVYLCNRKA